MNASSIAESIVRLHLGVRIPLRDGVHLNGTLYLPEGPSTPAPAVVALSPYIAQTYHERGMYTAAHGYPFLAVDSRGRGNSEGVFEPFIHEAKDGHDLIEWVARQPFCNGKVAMYGGSYLGYVQWATAKELPPHLATIVPVASAFMGVDVPMRNNIAVPYMLQWLTVVWGRTSQHNLFADNEYHWNAFRRSFEAGIPFKELDTFLGNPSKTIQEWLAHPTQDAYWDAYNPTPEQYAKISLPILTITGSYDSDQPGAMRHYREHLKAASPAARAPHYLVMGPWDHAGTLIPKTEFAGLTVGPASLVDLQQLRIQWYAWTMQDGPKPAFLEKNVAYYVTGAEVWRYADTLEEITSHSIPMYMHSVANPTDVFSAGILAPSCVDHDHDHYIYDPRDVSLAALESTVDPDSITDQRMILAAAGRHLVYHGAPFDEDREISGFFKLSVWLAIDQADTDFRVSVYDIGLDGASVLLSADWMRARYRESLREETLVRTTEALRYDFEHFPFVARRIKKGHRLRLVIGPLHSIHSQKNYNSGGIVSEESMKDARPVTVKLFHDPAHPSALHVPFGHWGI
jgi:putative CocE/NonD family hydrolase